MLFTKIFDTVHGLRMKSPCQLSQRLSHHSYLGFMSLHWILNSQCIPTQITSFNTLFIQAYSSSSAVTLVYDLHIFSYQRPSLSFYSRLIIMAINFFVLLLCMLYFITLRKRKFLWGLALSSTSCSSFYLRCRAVASTILYAM